MMGIHIKLLMPIRNNSYRFYLDECRQRLLFLRKVKGEGIFQMRVSIQFRQG